MSAETQALAAVARAELARRRLTDYAALVVPSYERAPHLELLCEHLEALERREINRLIVAMPPRHGKSLHVSQVFPSWWLGRRPRESAILASYASELAEQNSRRARACAQDASYPFPDVRVSDESSAVGRWHTTQGGGVLAAGVGAGITGWGADLLVVDDPVKDAEEASSEAMLERIWQWWTQVALTRLMPNAAVLLTMTRWSEGDLVGRVLESENAGEWAVLALPALAEEDDALGRAEGEALWAARYDRAALDHRRVDLGARAFNALYQQRPSSATGGTFQRTWLTGRYSSLPEGCHVVQAIDSAFKTGTANDWSVIATWATDKRFYYLLDVERGKWTYPELVKGIKREAEEWSPRAIVIEDAASGQSAIQTLADETRLPVVGVTPKGSKVSRAEAVSPLFEAGRVLLPEQSPPWLEPWVEQHVGFPGARHDDMVDTTSIALERLRGTRRSGAGVAGVVRRAHFRVGEPLDEGWRDPRGEPVEPAERPALDVPEHYNAWQRRKQRETPRGMCWSCGAAYDEPDARISQGGKLCAPCFRPGVRQKQYENEVGRMSVR
jgi:predicted phage terminase large subunit-like protein